MKKGTAEIVVSVGMILAILVLAVGFWVLKSRNEARTYERLTGQAVSTWDAMWVELRVMGGPGE